MNKTKTILHFTIGPVQSFVAQSRRTRDLWAGSFLLSWLAGQAMYAVRSQGGEIVFPVVEKDGKQVDPLFNAIVNDGQGTPHIGSVPNRFKASYSGAVDVAKVKEYVQKRWFDLANEVWKSFIKDKIEFGNGTEKIWKEQIETFWEINWVCGNECSDGSDGAWLDMRKNWRSHWPAVQGGDHCTLMGDWQEISGHIRSKALERQDKFWGEFQRDENVGRLDLRDGERLCAIALVKRLFPKLSKKQMTRTIGWPPGGSHKIVGNWPSTSYMAALPWLTSHQDNKLIFDEYYQTLEDNINAKDLDRLSGERATSIEKLDNLPKKIRQLDGNLFHVDALKNYRTTPLSANISEAKDKDPDVLIRGEVVKGLRKMGKVESLGNHAQPFYSLLIMDGDNMGKLLKSYDNQAISSALLNFTQKAKAIVEKNQGVLIYAGGDDVLALVSMTNAINCARELRAEYEHSFKNEQALNSGLHDFTISAGIVYAHYHLPLKKVMSCAHNSLDDVAKEKNGRNSIALTVMKAEGVSASWVGNFSGLTAKFVEFFNVVNETNKYSTSFFYNIRQRYPSLYDDRCGKIEQEDKFSLILAEYCKGRGIMNSEEKEAAADAVSLFLAASGQQKGGENDESIDVNNYLQFSSAYIARFITETGHNFSREKAGDS